ncbi:adenine nucleotide alpha hydrolase family protein [Alkalihalobacterium elongatum]|uniref:histidine kinase n=1 Tax=Alkalihalobacterium elongatum TaxID=2675466 RepID=UPI001C201035|nr:histidine kinase [Alkalihalobacterium elongatum]
MLTESILVCISNPIHAEKLIQRGKALAEAFDGECLVLFVSTKAYDEMDFNQLQTKYLFESLAEKYSVPLITRNTDAKNIATAIAETALEKNTTQIVLGQSIQTKVELWTKEPIINNLLSKITGIDIHIVEVTRDFHYESPSYERGINAHLVEENGHYALSFDCLTATNLKGVFFKEQATDFSNGFFVIASPNELKVVRIREGFARMEEVMANTNS